MRDNLSDATESAKRHRSGPRRFSARPSPRVALVAVTVLLVLAASAITAELVSGEVERSATDEAARNATSMVEAFVSPRLTGGALADPTSTAGLEIDTVLTGLVSPGNLVRIKVWRPDGTVVFSDLPALRGQTFEIDDDLGAALAGQGSSGLTDARAAENRFETGLASTLLEMYLPVHAPDGSVMAVYEIYQDASGIEAAITTTRLEVFLIAGGMAIALGILLMAAFKEVSRRLERQNRQLRDLTGTLRESEAQLRHQSFHDPLTSLPNRALFADRLEHALTRRRRNRAMPAVIVLDLDDFKTVNDTLGYGTGDGLLVEAGRRIVAAIRPGDTVCRLSGDEFAILLEEVGDIAQATEVADRVLASLARPLDVGPDVTMAASMGIAMVDDDVRDADDALTRADVAMYAAKANGKHRHESFAPAMRDRVWSRLELEAELRRGIERGELVVVYQPILDMTTRRPVEVEALVRWDHPTRGRLAPAEFLTVAEERGLIVPLGRFVLEQACREVADWRRRWPSRRQIELSVNLSSPEFRDPGLFEAITHALATSGLPASSLKIEITESSMLDADASDVLMRRIRDLGVRLAVDDFGTGFSSLSYFQRFPLDTLKIDRSFVSGLGRDTRSDAIVRATIAFAEALGLTVTAEGIETEAQFELLRTLGADRGQGYLFARPLDAADALSFFTHAWRASAA